MANYTEPIIIQIANDVTPNKKFGGKNDKSDNSLGSLASSLSKVLGVGAVIMEALKVLGDAINTILKPVKTMITGIFRLVSQLLRPIADVVVLLLMPVLQFIKPLIKVFNEIMRPYRTLAFSMMREANKTSDPSKAALLNTGAVSTIFAGFAMSILGVLKELLKSQVTIIASFIKTFLLNPLVDILMWSSPDFVKDAVKNYMSSNIDKGVVEFSKVLDSTFNTINSTVYNQMVDMAKEMGVSVQNLDTSSFTNALADKAQTAIDAAVRKLRNKTTDTPGVKSIDWTDPKTGTSYGTYFNEKGQGFSGVIPGTSQIDRAKALFNSLGVKTNGGVY